LESQNKYDLILWDWNGTLFNDLDWCMKTINSLLHKRNLKTLDCISDYHNVFCFPIIQYYENVGFDFTQEPFEKLAKKFITLYHSENTGNSQLCINACIVLDELNNRGITQIILSASEINNLLSQVNMFDIAHYFNDILGLTDIYAKSKIDIGKEYISDNNPDRAILIGDTTHDYEVANALSIDCLLIANGHQSKQTLLKCGVPVLDEIIQVLNYI
jgi:phosphoglycolate phosphatase